MSDITSNAGRDQRGRFIAGNTGNGGRPRGARSKLGEQFLLDLADTWNEHGVEALRRCAVEEPVQFVRVIAGLLPRDVNLLEHDDRDRCHHARSTSSVQALEPIA